MRPTKKVFFVFKSVPVSRIPEAPHQRPPTLSRPAGSENRRPVSPKTTRPKTVFSTPWTPTTHQTTFLEHPFPKNLYSDLRPYLFYSKKIPGVVQDMSSHSKSKCKMTNPLDLVVHNKIIQNQSSKLQVQYPSVKTTTPP